MAPLSILIVGCGIAGTPFATFLLSNPSQYAKEKPHITILERASTPRPQGQNIDIRGAGVTIMRKLGIETAVRNSITHEEGVQFVDDRNGIWIQMAADKTGKVQTGTSDLEILRGSLAEICWKRSRAMSREVQSQGGKGIEYIFGDYLESLEQDGEKVHVRLAKSGEWRSFDLVVGADGLQSRTRQMVWGEKGEGERVRQVAGMYGAFFSLPKTSNDSLWRRWYSAPGRRGVMVRPCDATQPDRMTAFMMIMNLTDERLRSAARDGRKGAEAQKALFAEYFEGMKWECPRIVDEMLKADDFYYDMIAQVKMEKWSKGRVVLLGDAGYCASPISGMGTTLAFNGAYNLAGAITQHPNDLPAALATYETKMRPIVDLAQRLPLGGQAPYIINLETAWGIWIRNRILWLIALSGIVELASRFAGPPADKVKVEEFGLSQLEEWVEGDDEK
ncbi:hypothetical protein LTR91_016963 [Friedmanniomyces endolithicus]|uniref:FAD-binding domain-containing protein n=1 Tax=Friedmanniomyces endolithicus TaxID=329885 RepID=A0AAN6QK23_9PEZI|nr:hypothetical protein LTR94_006918 [Friedmanniomyces endolithicus]KAK0787862.1 hypothetical protein LTR75_012758 [Friedmanniomyces endolithicus]KAK0799471.1 hypothetical protein LTR59_006109 [Friedmanniomyces endolithicus]KAK0809557.1 hypothetical protein LTR38_004252 [Friedmanniomyces endolithicus]KAK0852672.1 hypothetical protein LTR03_003385 [Friedmanniomyces endolithicus]